MFSAWRESPSDPFDLRLYHAESLGSAWQEHRQSPIVSSDSRLARPSGRVIKNSPVAGVGAGLTRFAQDCSSTYGERVYALSIDHLSCDKYVESEWPQPVLVPGAESWNIGGMHHIDAHRVADLDQIATGADKWVACVDGWSA